MKGVKHYTKSGEVYKGGSHKMPNGDLHSGKTHTSSSKKFLSMVNKEKFIPYKVDYLEKYKIKRVTKVKKSDPGGMGTFLSYSSNREWEVSYRERVEDDFSPKISFKNMLDAKMWAEDHKNAKEG